MHRKVICQCGRKATFNRPTKQRPGQRRDHDLCRQCWRALMEHERAIHIEVPSEQPTVSAQTSSL